LINRFKEYTYDNKGDHIVIIEGAHAISRADIPDSIDGVMVTHIAKKAFLGCKLLKEVIVPEGVRDIGDYAFANCDHLTEVSFCNPEVKLGQQIFKNDTSLKSVMTYSGRNDYEAVKEMSVELEADEIAIKLHAGELIAAASVVMDADYLVDITQMYTPAWFEKWDNKLRDFLMQDDAEGYSQFVLCGEEDIYYDHDEYIEYTRRKKAGLCMLRLLNDSLCDEDFLREIQDYVVGHTLGCESEASIGYILESHPDNVLYYELLVNTAAINNENKEDMIKRLGDRHPEIKAYIIEHFNNEINNNEGTVGGFFDSLEW